MERFPKHSKHRASAESNLVFWLYITSYGVYAASTVTDVVVKYYTHYQQLPTMTTVCTTYKHCCHSSSSSSSASSFFTSSSCSFSFFFYHYYCCYYYDYYYYYYYSRTSVGRCNRFTLLLLLLLLGAGLVGDASVFFVRVCYFSSFELFLLVGGGYALFVCVFLC